MFQDPLFILVIIAALSVLVVLAIGVGGFALGGEFNRKHGNRMMRYRIIAQFIAIAAVLLFLFVRSKG
jgi:uncharacterized membrane protein